MTTINISKDILDRLTRYGANHVPRPAEGRKSHNLTVNTLLDVAEAAAQHRLAIDALEATYPDLSAAWERGELSDEEYKRAVLGVKLAVSVLHRTAEPVDWAEMMGEGA